MHSIFLVSFVRKSYVPKQLVENLNQGNPPRYKGIGGKNVHIINKISCYVKFNKKLNKIELNVIPDDAMVIPIILGRDFLSIFNIRLTKIKTKGKQVTDVGGKSNLDLPETPQPVIGSKASSFMAQSSFDENKHLSRNLTADNCREKINASPIGLPDIFHIDIPYDRIEVDINDVLTKDESFKLKQIIQYLP
ncbi:PREDICTED: uncharacterized protein LOC108363281 [Rhagoletis zephyria]|uniref:uncharacterized protein LOC108363281 n=1 Tax=Rhagoletis zephyria TaxID=28612 RepID=UPI00081188B2|nr:PREDICTED: uncharacterized protein LOC108363281 [Rhagoletis zephyria]